MPAGIAPQHRLRRQPGKLGAPGGEHRVACPACGRIRARPGGWRIAKILCTAASSSDSAEPGRAHDCVAGQKDWVVMMTRALIVLVLCVAAPAAAGQGIATTFQELRLLVRPGDHVTVTDVNGRDVSGKIKDLSASSLALTVDGQPREWRETEVATIRQRRGDSLANGAWIGLGIGAGLAAVGIAVAFSSEDYDGDVNFGEAVLVTAMYGGLGAAIGTGIDALITRRQVIFETRSPSGIAFQFAPLLTPTRAVARVSIGF
jgi:hypothetical protein